MWNAEIKYYSNDLNIHKNDVLKSLKTIIGKHTNNIERKMSFSIKDAIVNHFVSIGPTPANDISSDVNSLSCELSVCHVTSMGRALAFREDGHGVRIQAG